MSDISAKDVMKLRNSTGLSMMECKKAIVEAGGDPEKAEDLLRRKLKGKMDARTDRAAGEGRIAVAINPQESAAAIVELRAETDFTAKNENFVRLANDIAQLTMRQTSGGVPVTDAMTALIDPMRAQTGENISYARGHKLAGAEGKTEFGSYVHHDGKTGVLIQAEGSITEDTLRDVCMHITAAVPRPAGISANDVPANVIEKERRFRIEQAIESGKPKEIAEKMVEGGMRKFFEEVALLEQPFIKDPTKKVKDIVGDKATIIAFFRWQVGEQG